ncbi:MAG: GNAT family N-acetyltransferase [Rhodothermales bacterium]|nr:GNAT family N-acetyltransferase [Rhodothermales bacterium]
MPSAEPKTLNEIEIREGTEGLTPARIATLYRRAPLLRPTSDRDAIRDMFERSSLVLSVWMGDRLVGLARVLTDGVLFSFLCDLAVEPDVQGAGIGKRLIDEVLRRCAGTELVLRDSDISSGFYERLGFVKVENGWVKRLPQQP